MCDFDRVEALLDGTLPRSERAAAEAHIKNCPDCRRWYQGLQMLREEEIPAPAGFADRVMDQVRNTKQEKKNREKRRWTSVAAAAACAVLVLAFGWGFIRPSQNAAFSRMTDDVSTVRAQDAAYASNEEPALELNRREADEVRRWLREKQREPDRKEKDGEVYLLSAEETAALGKAMPELELPDEALKLYLPE